MKFILRILSLAVGMNMLVFGVHQFIKPAYWTSYIPEFLVPLLPFSKRSMMRLHGSGNLSLGALLISLYRLRLTSLFVLAWWLFVTPFCARNDWRTGVRDITIVGAAVAIVYIAYHNKQYEL